MASKQIVQTELSKRSGVGQTTISLYLSPERRQPSKTGKMPSAKLTEIESLARALDVTLVQILSPGLKEVPIVMVSEEAANDDHAPVRLLDARASAGHGSLVFSEDTDRVLMFRRDWLARHDAKPDDVLAFPVRGASMVDMHIVDGSVVLVNQGKKEPVSKKVYVLWIDGKLYVKQLVKHNGQWLARSHNAVEAAKFPDIPIEINDRIVGRAFWCGFSL